MILKEKDSQRAQIQALRQAVAAATTNYERSRCSKELALVLAGVDGEKEAAYYLDFHLKDARNWMVLHDLRLEWNGRVAQIDHLVINRMLETYVIESKNLKTKVRYQNGGWERMQDREWEGFPCPIEQNRRHILVLKQLIEDLDLLPKRMGMTVSPSYVNVVAVNPACSIVGNFPKDAKVWKMDGLVRELQDDFSNPMSLLSVVAQETLANFAQKLLAHHCPVPVPVSEKAMELRDQAEGAQVPATNEAVKGEGSCDGCGGPVKKEEAFFCRVNRARFGGRVLCRKCQTPKATGRESALPAKAEATGKCAECGVEVDSKVIAFCRFNSKKFNKRVLCRDCQKV